MRNGKSVPENRLNEFLRQAAGAQKPAEPDNVRVTESSQLENEPSSHGWSSDILCESGENPKIL